MPNSHPDAGTGPGLEAPFGDDRGRERLGGEVRGRLRVARPTRAVTQHGSRMAVIEHTERLSARVPEQFLVGERIEAHVATLARTRPDITSSPDGYGPAPASEGQGMKTSP